MFTGEKVILRAIKREDIERMHKFNQDVECHILNGILPHVLPFERAEKMYERYVEKDSEKERFAIEADGKYIGYCGLYLVYPGVRRLGILIGDREYWGKGYGSDAVKLLLYYGFHYLGSRRIDLGTNAKNVRAIKCFKACGFVEEGRPRKVCWIDGDYTDLVNMGIMREEWEAIQRDKTKTTHSVNNSADLQSG
ncbi:MAG: GNAT family N-acetyltransferase [Candidatus Sabulitectum sp.]|nr:GNAT family N-acetyltransferase [Candidatus Sabulitectum sp.]